MKKYLALLLVLLWCVSKLDWSAKGEGCPFCEEKFFVYRGEVASVRHTYKPVVEGHVLVIPNRHVERFEELTPEELEEMGTLVKQFHGDGDYLLVQKNGKKAGQSVPHVHIHVIPCTGSQVLLALKFFIRPFLKPVELQSVELSWPKSQSWIGS